MKILTHNFVELIPDVVPDGIIFVSVKYKTAVHICACGCGERVVTPLAPDMWRLSFDGKTISLSPSIGNWGFNCKSHYFITNNRVIDLPRWLDKNTEDGFREKPKKEKRKRRKWWRR